MAQISVYCCLTASLQSSMLDELLIDALDGRVVVLGTLASKLTSSTSSAC